MKYSIIKVIVNDWPALASSIGIPFIWLIHYAFPYISKVNEQTPLLLPIVVTNALVVVLWWRIKRVAWFFNNGIAASGKVVLLRIVKDRGRIEFTFNHQGGNFSAWSPIHKTKRVLSLVPGTNIEVLFDAENPTKAIIKELYAS